MLAWASILGKGIRRTMAISLLTCAAMPALSQSVTKVEKLGVVSATQIANGLGFNVDPQNDWEFQLAQAAGATEVRIQCGWGAVETQTSQNTSGGYQMPTTCVSALKSAATYNLHPLVIAAYGPPYHAIVTLKTTAAVPVGAYTIPVVATSGTLAQINIPYCHVYESDRTQLTATDRWAYEGSLITAVNTSVGTISIASKTAIAIPAGTVLLVNQNLYASPATTDPTEPSIVAYAGPPTSGYGGYVGFLAKGISDAGLTGRVEIWNEPPWPHDPWDQRWRFYDANIPANLSQAGDQAGFVAALEPQTPPGGVRYAWGGPHKTGFSSLLGTRNPHPTEAQAQASINSEEVHPYGNDPEDNGWDPGCLALLNGWFQCNLSGTDPNGNIKAAAQYNLQNMASYGWGIEQDISETGTLTQDQIAKARYIMRQYVMYQGLGIKKIDFFELADAGANFGFIDLSTSTPTIMQPYTSLKSFMADIKSITGAATPTFATANFPSVAKYAGYYPLSTVQITGSTSSVVGSNALMFVVWQRSVVANLTDSWLALPSPQPVPVTIQIPNGTKATVATNLSTRANVPFTVSGLNVTFNVTDDPVSVMLVPVPALTLTEGSSSLSFKAGATGNNTDPMIVAVSGGLSGTFALSCTVTYNGTGNVTFAPSCTLANTSVTLADGGAASSILTISTTAPQARKGTIQAGSGGPKNKSMASFLFASVVPLIFFSRKVKTRRLAVDLASCLFAFVGVLMLSGCGTIVVSRGGAVTTPILTPGTTAGSYTVVVTASGSSAGSPISASNSVALTVQ